MKIYFKKLILHNFLSYGHSEIDLDNRGFCLVKGINECPKDNALSNGSGKSSWSSAICWALTGETIQGIRSNIKNIYVDEDSCWVELQFTVNSNDYRIIRYNRPKSDMKIFVNGEDKSGKGIRESELVLSEYLPDLTRELIASVILLGQGLPFKLSSFSPSGRKEVLEKLSKSDFMIEDIKQRLNTRQNKVESEKKLVDDDLIKHNTALEIYTTQLNQLTEELNTLKSVDIGKLCDEREERRVRKASIEYDISNNVKATAECKELLNKVNSDKFKLLEEKTTELKINDNAYNVKNLEYSNKENQLVNDIRHLQDEITKIDSIKEVCPLCGQKIPNVNKPSTDGLKEQRNKLNDELLAHKEVMRDAKSKYDNYCKEISDEYDVKINDCDKEMRNIRNSLDRYDMDYADFTRYRDIEESEITKLTNTITNHESQMKSVQEKIDNTNKLKVELENKIADCDATQKKLNSHLEVLKKMDTLVKRDFRGYLLSNVIEYINAKAKEYCSQVFGCDEFEFTLDGNDIDISYCGKEYESLSGGEKQKIDLVLEFSIRDMMTKYLNFSSNILVLDEIFDGLDSKSTDNVLSLISGNMRDIESTFIVSHHSDSLELPVDEEMTIVKNRNGISEVR